MRTVYDNTGADITATAKTTMFNATTLPLADLFWFSFVSPGDPALFGHIKYTDMFVTSAPYPVGVAKLQATPGSSGVVTINATYLPANIARGTLTYEVGLSDQTCEVTWFVDDTITLTNVTWGLKWALVSGYLDDSPVWIHRGIFTPNSNPNLPPTLVGTSLMWRGFIRDCKVDRGQVVITLASLIHIFQQVQVPSQTVQAGSRLPPFAAAGNGSVIGGSLGCVFESASTPIDLQFTAGAPTPDHAMRDAIILSINEPPPNVHYAQSGKPQPQVFRIRDNVNISGVLHVYPYEPINPLTLIGNPNSSPQYINFFLQSDIGSGSVAPGFPLVPTPETGL